MNPLTNKHTNYNIPRSLSKSNNYTRFSSTQLSIENSIPKIQKTYFPFNYRQDENLSIEANLPSDILTEEADATQQIDHMFDTSEEESCFYTVPQFRITQDPQKPALSIGICEPTGTIIKGIYFPNTSTFVSSTLTLSSGKTFENVVLVIKSNQEIELTLKNKTIFQGCAKSEFGKVFFPNNDKYEGSVFQGDLNGRGKYYFSNGFIYESSFFEGEPIGNGKLTHISDKSIFCELKTKFSSPVKLHKVSNYIKKRFPNLAYIYPA